MQKTSRGRGRRLCLKITDPQHWETLVRAAKRRGVCVAVLVSRLIASAMPALEAESPGPALGEAVGRCGQTEGFAGRAA